MEKRDEPLATGDVEPLRAGAELARGHVLDHALAKRADNIDAHGKLLSRMRLTNTSILPTGSPARYRRSRSRSAMLTQSQQAIAQRFSAVALKRRCATSAI